MRPRGGPTEEEPTRFRGAGAAALLERAPVLAAVDSVIDSCGQGVGQLFVVEGPAGIGKTSVLAEARSRAGQAGMSVLQARASELERSFSYGVVRQLFEHRLRQVDDAARRDLFDGAAVHAARLFDHHQIDDAAGEVDGFAVIHGLYWLALNLAEAQPLAIAVDDLQWADAASLRWLAYLARRLETEQVCAFGTVRTGAEEDPVLSELLADQATIIVHPAPLTPSAVAELVRAGLGGHAEAEFCAACHRASGGNPLLVHELVRTVEMERIAPTSDSVEIVEDLAPEAVSRSVTVRLSRLPDEAGSVARAIAVLGDRADGLHVAELARIDSRALSAAAAALSRLQLIHHDQPLRFVHPVLRSAVYQSITGRERAEAHTRAAALLATARQAPRVIAAQLLHTPPGAVNGATSILREAARAAAAEGSLESTATYLVRCLREPLSDLNRADVMVALARAEMRSGAPTALDRLSEALTMVHDPQRRASLQYQLACYQLGFGREQAATRTLEQALVERPGGEDDQSRRLEGELLMAAMHNRDRQTEAHARLDSLDLAASDGPGARFLLGVRAYSDTLLGVNRQRALADAERALADATDYPEESEFSPAYGRMLHVLILGDSFPAASRFVEELVLDARQRGGAQDLLSALGWRAGLEYASGALYEAEADIRLMFENPPATDTVETPWLYALLAQVLVERGSVDDAAELLASFEAEVGALRSDHPNHRVLFRARAQVASTRGNHRAALVDALVAGSLARQIGFVNPAVDFALGWRSEAALAHHLLGDDDAARGLAREQLELARAWGAPRTLGQALRILGVVETGDAALDRLREAVAVLETSHARLEHAYALTDLGSALRRTNQRAAAREPLRFALELAQRGGATLLAARAHEELIAAGARPRRLVISGVDSLTPTERRVASMAADGLSNREIAQSLFVTLRTIETHLTGAFRKLDLNSRTQLPAVLASTGHK